MKPLRIQLNRYYGLSLIALFLLVLFGLLLKEQTFL